MSRVAQEEKVTHVLLVSGPATFVDLYPGGHRALDATVVLCSVSRVAQEEKVAPVLLVSGAETFATAVRSRFPL
jgi:acyl-CoA reductase-like NAD-dependent aldehyde dehydrogenase